MKISVPLGDKNYLIETELSGMVLKELYKSKDKEGKEQDKESILGYYSNLGSAVNKLIHSNLAVQSGTVTLSAYIKYYETLYEKVIGLCNPKTK